MNEREFVFTLQKRAREQEKVIKTMPFPRFYAFVAEWLSDYPWRFIIPLSLIISFILRLILGISYTNFILLLFRQI